MKYFTFRIRITLLSQCILVNYKTHSPPLGACTSSDAQEIHHTLRNPKVHCRDILPQPDDFSRRLPIVIL